MSTSTSDEEHPPRYSRENRVARKSTAPQNQSNYSTRRQATLQHLNKITCANPYKFALRSASDRFMENFNPETSVREKRKLNRKINTIINVRRPVGALYDEHGIHINTYMDLCDCLNEDCEGCFFDCPKCGSQKCGTECRVHRKFIVEQIEYHGYDIVVKSPLMQY